LSLMKVYIYIIKCSKTDRVYVGRTSAKKSQGDKWPYYDTDWTHRCKCHFQNSSRSLCKSFIEPEFYLLEKFDYIDYPHMVQREQYYIDLYSHNSVNKIKAG